jgi:hypothetical protein
MTQPQVKYEIDLMERFLENDYMKEVYRDLHPTAEQQGDKDWWNDIYIQTAVNSDDYNFPAKWAEQRDASQYEALVMMEMINQIFKWNEDENGISEKWWGDALTISKIYRMYAYLYVIRMDTDYWINLSHTDDWNFEMEEPEQYNGSKNFPPNETDETCPICLEAYTEENPKDGIRCSDIPSNCSHYCCERCWYVIWGQHNDTNNCSICKRNITMWLSTHYPNQAITDFLKTLPPK